MASSDNPLATPTRGNPYSEASEAVQPWGEKGLGPARVIFNNPGAELKSGNLLLSWQSDQACYQFDTQTGEIDFICKIGRQGGLFIWRSVADSAGNVYLAYSGVIQGNEPFHSAGLGKSGGIVSFNFKELATQMPWLPEMRRVSPPSSDPIGFQFLDRGRLLVADMGGWGGSGEVYVCDDSGNKEKSWVGGRLVDPVKAVQDSEGIIWVANGNQVTQDGDLIRIDKDGYQDVVAAKRGHFTGCMVDVLTTSRKNELLVIRDNLPTLDNSSIELLDTRSGKSETILAAERGAPRFFSQADIIDGVLWVAECIRSKMLRINLSNGDIEELDLSPLLGKVRGIKSSFSVIESVSVIR